MHRWTGAAAEGTRKIADIGGVTQHVRKILTAEVLKNEQQQSEKGKKHKNRKRK